MYDNIPDNKKSIKCNFISGLIKLLLIFAIFFINIAFFNNLNNFNSCFAEGESEVQIEENLEGMTNEVLGEIDFSGLDELVFNLDKNIGFFQGDSFKEYVLKVLNGDKTIAINELFNVIIDGVKAGVKALIIPLITIFAVVLIVNTFSFLKSNKISGVSEIVYFICFSVVVIIVSGLVKGVIDESLEALLNMKKQMDIMFPIMLSLIASMGGVLSVSAFSPVSIFLSNIVSTVFIYVLLPLFSLNLILSIVGNMSKNTKLDKLSGFVKSVFKWVVGVVFTIFMGFLSVKSFSVGVTDGLSIKATKYAIKNYIPMLGGYISDGFEFMKAGCLLVKNATGIVGVLLLFSSIIAPVLLVGVLELCLKFLAGFIEVVGDKKISNLVYSISSSLKLLVVVLVGVALMYFLSMFVLICSVSNFV